MALEDPRGQSVAAYDVDARVSIRVSRRARRIALRIDAAERKVELVLPAGVPPSHGLRFLATKQGWIAARLAALPQPVRFAEGVIVPVLGIPHRIRREDDPAAPPVAICDGEIRVRGDPAHLERRVRDHLVAMARAEFADRARRLAARINPKWLRELNRIVIFCPARHMVPGKYRTSRPHQDGRLFLIIGREPMPIEGS